VDIVKALRMSGADIPAELVAMANGFIAKVKSGLEKMHGTGFGGKGLEKLEQERDIMKKIQKKSHGAELDEVSDEEEEGIDAASKEALEAQFDARFVEAESDNANAPVQKKMEPSGIAKAREIAAGLSAMGKATVATTSGAIVAYEIEINDFPQRARWRATSKETIALVTEITGAAITTRGSYIPPGRSTKLGERKLYLHIEGPTRDIIDRAKSEIKQVLFETTVESMEADPYAGRYTVL
jgi:ATP-dependent RNA helicase DDX46/PRP5